MTTPRYFQRLPAVETVEHAVDLCSAAGGAPILHALLGVASTVVGVVELPPPTDDERAP